MGLTSAWEATIPDCNWVGGVRYHPQQGVVSVVGSSDQHPFYEGGFIIALSAVDGSRLCRVETASRLRACICAADTLAVSTKEGRLTVADLNDGSVRWRARATAPLGVFGDTLVVAAGARVRGYDIETGDRRWQTVLPEHLVTNVYHTLCDSGLLLVLTSSCLCVVDASGTVSWSRSLGDWRAEIHESEIFLYSHIENAEGSVPVESPGICRLDTATGDVAWGGGLDDDATEQWRVTADAVYVVLDGRLIRLDPKTGAREWVSEATGLDKILYPMNYQEEEYDGWNCPQPTPAPSSDTVYVSARETTILDSVKTRLVAVDAETGRTVWRSSVDGSIKQVDRDETTGGLFLTTFIDDNRQLSRVDTSTGKANLRSGG